MPSALILSAEACAWVTSCSEPGLPGALATMVQTGEDPVTAANGLAASP